MQARFWLAAMVLLPLTGCGSSDPVPAPVTSDEATALDQAAEMFDSRPSEAPSDEATGLSRN
jgi:predicted small lipoprotein YifL